MSPLTAKGELIITRLFNAPREKVFEAWVDPDHFKNWFGPHDSTMPTCRIEARPGGTIFFCHHFEGGNAVFKGERDIWIKGSYLEVVRPEKLVFALHFSDEAGNRVERPGFSSMESRIEVTFKGMGKQTEVVIRHTGLKADQGESEGWKQGLERLEEMLKQKVRK